MRVLFAVRVRRAPLSGRSIVRRAGVFTGVAACLGLTAAFWVPSVRADTSGTATWPIDQAFRSIELVQSSHLNLCVHWPDNSAANGLAMPNGQCGGAVTVKNTGDEAQIRVAHGASTSTGDGSVVPCASPDAVPLPTDLKCTGAALASSTPFAHGVTQLPGDGQYLIRITSNIVGSAAETLRTPPNTSCDTAFMGQGLPQAGCRPAFAGQNANESIYLFGPHGGGAQLSSVSVIWEAVPFQ